MPPARKKAKKSPKLKTLTILNHHSSLGDQLRGNHSLHLTYTPTWTAVSANHSKTMEGSLNKSLQDSQKVEIQTLSEEKKVAVEVDIAITEKEEAPQREANKELVEYGNVEVTNENVYESVADFFEPDAVKDSQVENKMESDTVELELMEEQEKDFLSDLAVVNDEMKETDLPSSEENNEFSSGNEGLRETEVAETIVKVMMVAEEEMDVLSNVETENLLRKGEEPNEVHDDSFLPLTEVASEETVETSVLKSNESDKVASTIIEKSLALEPTLVEKVEEPSGGQEESSYESVKESLQPLPSVPDAESSPRTQNPTVGPVAQRENTSWKSCCGLFEIMRGGDR